MGRKTHDFTLRVKEARNGSANCPDLVFVLELLDHLHDRAGQPVSVLRGLRTHRVEDRPIRRDHRCTSVRPANVKADCQRLVSSL